MNLVKSLCVALFFAAAVGCGAVTDDDPVDVTPPSTTEKLKASLNDVAQTGQMGSGMMTIEQEIEKLRATDAAKADALKADYEQLKTMNNPAQAKAKAQEMLGKL
jgi:hypothetical protein